MNAHTNRENEGGVEKSFCSVEDGGDLQKHDRTGKRLSGGRLDALCINEVRKRRSVESDSKRHHPPGSTSPGSLPAWERHRESQPSRREIVTYPAIRLSLEPGHLGRSTTSTQFELSGAFVASG
jgi:hypothetical protein